MTEEPKDKDWHGSPSDFWMDGGGNSLVCDEDECGQVETDNGRENPTDVLC